MQALLDVHAAHAFWLWGGLAAALLAVEILTGSGWLLWASASAAVVAFAAQFGGLPPAQAILLFAGLTIVSALAARRYLPRAANAPGGDINDNVARLIGQRGRASTAFDGRSGRVSVDGKEWAAELEGETAVAAGDPIEVVGVAGAHLTVRRIPT